MAESRLKKENMGNVYYTYKIFQCIIKKSIICNYKGGEVMKKNNVIGLISILIPSITTVLIINFLLDIVPIERLEGLPIFFPFIAGPIGTILAVIAYKNNRDKLSATGIVFNLALIVFPFFYNVFGTLINGV